MDDPTSDVPAPAAHPPVDGSTRRRPGARAAVARTLRSVLTRARTWRPRHGWWAATGLTLVALAASVLVGVTTASVEASLGPHLTRYDVTTDSTVTIDFGPLGTLQLDSPLPLTLGVRATVQEIPASVTELGEARTLQALSNDLAAYVQFFSGPAAAVRDIATALVADAVRRTLITFAALVVTWFVVRALLGQGRRDELVATLAVHRRPVTAGTLAVVLGATVLTSSVAPVDRPASGRLSSAVFDGTPLEGARVTGRLGGVIDTYGAYAVDAWRQNEAFYRDADEALVVAWQDWLELEDELAEEAAREAAEAAREAARAERAAAEEAARPAAEAAQAAQEAGGEAAGDPDVQPAPPDPSATEGAEAGADGVTDGWGASGEAGTASPSPTPSPTPVADPVVLVVVSDLHCNVGMAPLIGTLADLAGADAVLDAGDTTMNGTSVEQYCVTSFARALPAGVPLVTSPGNHDSRETSGFYARAGATVLEGSVVEVAGVRILGDHDPNETRIGNGGTRTAADETTSQAARRLAQVACEDGDVDLLLVHTPAVGDAALEDGCVPAQVSGHYHRRVGPEQVGLGIRYVSSSTAGATLGQPTVGPLRGVAEMTVLRLDPATGEILDHQVVQVRPDATVAVGRPAPWPSVVEPADEETDEETGDGSDPATPPPPGTEPAVEPEGSGAG